MDLAGWAAASSSGGFSPDWVSAGTVTAVLSVLGVVGGAIAWVRSQLNRREDLRAAEQARQDTLHRDDREWWADRLGIRETEAEYRTTLATLERAHRAQLDEQHAEHLADLAKVHRRMDQLTRATEVRGLRHRRWDEGVRRDLVALGGRDPGDPPALYETDGEVDGEWVEDPPSSRPGGPDLPRRRVEDEDTETA